MIKSIFKISAILFLLFALVFITSCKKEEVILIEDTDSIENETDEADETSETGPCDEWECGVTSVDFMANWNWAASSCLETGDHISAEDVDYNIHLVITDVSIQRFVNAELEYDLPYTVEFGLTLEGDQTDIMIIDGDPVPLAMHRQEDVLILTEQIEEGYIHQYAIVY